jgi:phage shock protein B
MLNNLAGLLIPLAGICMVVALRYLKYKQNAAGQLGVQEQAALDRMGDIAQRLEKRVITLERILDNEVPSWRSDPANFYQQASNER